MKKVHIHLVGRLFVAMVIALSMFAFSWGGIAGADASSVPPQITSGRTYYVSTNGSDTNPGSISLPWKTVDTAVSRLTAGDTLYLRGGTYTQQVNIRVSGNAQAPITISGHPNEQVVFDGQGSFPSGAGSYMISVRGSWVTVKDMEIANSGRGGVFADGTHVTVQNLNIHHAQDAAITLTGDYDLALNNHAWSDGLMNENNKSGTSGGWPAIITCARYPKYCTLRGNTVSDSWGEGLSTFEATYTTIEDNISYNNQQNFYLSDTKYTVMRRNLSYCTPGNAIDPYMTQNGILVGDEKGVLINNVRSPSSDNQIVNNLVMGCDRNLAAGTKVSTNNLYAYNTFVNSGGDGSERGNVLIYASGSCTNCRFINNLILQETSNPISVGGGVSNGWTFANNLWSKSPGSNFTGSNDVIANPLLAKVGSTAPGELTAAYFQITAGSPAINKAKGLSEVPDDFFQTPRSLPSDIGAASTATQLPVGSSDRDTTGVFRPSNGLLYLKNQNITGFADVAINYGLAGDYPVVGDWDGNGDATIGVYRNGQFMLRNSNAVGFADMVFAFGQIGDQPVAGDWNGDGIDTIGVYRPSNGLFLLRNSNSAGPEDMSFYLGNVGDVGIAGDWNGDGKDTTGVFRPSNGVIFLKNTNETGFADIALNYGIQGDKPVTGDWNSDGIDTIGVYRNGQFLLRNSNTAGFADIVFALGISGDLPIAGNWDGMP